MEDASLNIVLKAPKSFSPLLYLWVIPSKGQREADVEAAGIHTKSEAAGYLTLFNKSKNMTVNIHSLFWDLNHLSC